MIKNIVSGWLAENRRYRKPPDGPDGTRARHGGGSATPQLPEFLCTAIERAQQAILRMQHPEDGYWCGPIFGDTTIDSDTIMMLNFLGQGSSPKVARIANHLLHMQKPDGGWPIYRNGPSEISATVKAYWALKFAGHAPQEPCLVSARQCIERLGGIHQVNTYTKFYLALFGQYDWRGVPTIPPEIMMLPNWAYFNVYAMSAWTRAIVVPLTIVWARQPTLACPDHATLGELFPDARRHVPLAEAVAAHPLVSWKTFFLLCDSGLKSAESLGDLLPLGERLQPQWLRPGWLRAESLRRAESWMLERLQESDGLGAIYPAILNSILAMKCLGYADEDPRLIAQLREIDRLELADEQSTRFQPTLSPVWDTAISTIALAESGLDPAHPALCHACRWTISKEIRVRGDWAATKPDGPTGGWPFQFRNVFNPDIDDTAMVLLSLRQVRLEEPDARLRDEAFQRGLAWILSMQSTSGGWAAYDKDNTKAVLTKIPFADHNAMIDPPTADVTARVLELLGYLGHDASYPPVARALKFLKAEQEFDGSWYGRWGVNYIYGTWQALRGLAAIGEDMNQPYIQRAAAWLQAVQRPDGGWGETCATYENPALKGQGPSTPAQTAWALMGLMAAGVGDDSVRRGIGALTSTQRDDGTWDETEFTGTGFPKVYYLEYTMYRNYFPLQALGNYRKALLAGGEGWGS